MAAENCIRSCAEIDDALYVIGGKWRLKIIIALFDGARRFNEIQRAVPGISAKVLTTELKHLELNSFVRRGTSAATAAHYELTDYSKTLQPVVHALHNWGKAHREKIMPQSS